MPSFRTTSPPHSSFNKPTPPHFSRRSPSVISNDSILSHFPQNMIPPQYAPNPHPSSQFSSPPSPTMQNSILSQPWLWLPQHKCRILDDEDPHAVYLIKLATWDGFEKRFDLQLLTPSSSNRGFHPEILQNISEDLLRAPRDAAFQTSTLPVFHNTTSLPRRPRAPIRRMSSSVGMHGQALGITEATNLQTLFQYYGPGSSVNAGNEFSYSPYNSARSSPVPQQYFGNGQRERHRSPSSPHPSVRGGQQSGDSSARGVREDRYKERRGGYSSSSSTSSRGSSRGEWRSGGSRTGQDGRKKERRGGAYSSCSSTSSPERHRSGSGGTRSDRDGGKMERNRSGSGDSSSQERGRYVSGGRRSNGERSGKKVDKESKGYDSERKSDSRKSSPKGTKQKEKDNSSGKESKPRSRSRSPAESFFSVKMKK